MTMPPDDPMLQAVHLNGAQRAAGAPPESNRVYLVWGTACCQPGMGVLYFVLRGNGFACGQQVDTTSSNQQRRG